MPRKSTFRKTKHISRKFTVKSQRKTPVSKKPSHPLYLKSLAILTPEEIEQLARITSDPETMKWIGKGTIWSQADIVEFRNDERQERGLPHNRRKHYTYVMMLGQQIIGFIEGRKSIYNKISRNDLLLRIFISRDYTGRGYGKMIIKLFLELYTRMVKPRSPGKITIYSDIDSNNMASIKIHLANGFELIKTTKYPNGKTINRYRKII